MADGDAIPDVMIFGLYFHEVLQNKPKTVLGWTFIVLFIDSFILLQKMCRIIYLEGKRCPLIPYYDNRYLDFVNFCCFFHIFERKRNAKTSFRLEIKR